MFKSNDPIELVGMFLCGLTCFFAAAKIEGALSWSWLWVLAPLWIPAALLILGGAVYLIAALRTGRKDKKKSDRRKEE